MISVSACKKDEGTPDVEGEIGTKVGQIAPDFTLPDKDGNEKSLSDFDGELVVVDFWASWCHFCRDENPGLVSLYAEYKDKGLDIVGVSIDTDKSNWISAIQADGILFDQLSDLQGIDSPVTTTYGVESVPSMILIDKSGTILLVTSKASDIADYVSRQLN